MTRAAVCATDARAQRAAERALADGGGAADAAVAAFFTLAGADARVLLAPLTVIVAGAGSAGRAIDGRAAQPGIGAPRPRGFVEGAKIPLAARAAVPRSLHAALVLQGAHGRRSLKKNVAQGISEAKSAGSLARAAFFARIVERGALALTQEHDAILRTAGRYVSGLMTAEDLEAIVPGDVAAETKTHPTAGGDVARLHLEPWPAAPNTRARGKGVESVGAADGRGLLVGLSCFLGPASGPELPIPELGVCLPLVAEPVRRGLTRIAPGTVFAVPRTLAALDAGPALRAIALAPSGLDLGRAAAALAHPSIEKGLYELGGTKRDILAVLATLGQSRPLPARQSA